MDIRHFFNGKLKKEESASAFLAMALEGSEPFRRHFFSLVDANEAEALGNQPWRVEVEAGRVDVCLAGQTARILIENKINAGAKQKEQLLRCYRNSVKAHPQARVYAVYLSPGSMGKSEVECVLGCKEFRSRQGDRCVQVSWEELADYLPFDSGLGESIVVTGLGAVSAAIEDGKRGMYLAIGERAVLRSLVDAAYRELKPQYQFGLKRWSGKEAELIVSNRTQVTMSIGPRFGCSEEPGFPVVDVRNGGGDLAVLVRRKVRLRTDIKSKASIRAFWDDLTRRGTMMLGDGSAMTVDEEGWFVNDVHVEAPEAEFPGRVKSLFQDLVAVCQATLSAPGYGLLLRTPGD